jgi:gliding motility-associated lipoprotein GldB
MLMFLAFAKALLSCDTTTQQEQEIASIPIDVDLIPFHQRFVELKPQELPDFKQRFPAFFPQQVPDSVWLDKIERRDTIFNVLQDAIESQQFDYDQIENDVVNIMKHVEFYFPEFKPTDIITVLSEVDTDLKVVPTPDYLIIGIDNYLGSDNELYTGISRFKTKTMDVDYLPSDVALAYAQLFLPPLKKRRFLDHMIYAGKLHYLQSIFAPSQPSHQHLGYTEAEMNFASENEEQVWRYFIDREMLYKTDASLLSRFLLPAPFSKFYLEIDQDTPGGIARFMGYQIVSTYMQNNDVSIQDLISMDAQTIFNNSRYKP